MTTTAVAWAFEQQHITPPAKLLLIVLADRAARPAWDVGDVMDPTIATTCCFNPDQLSEAVSELCDSDLLLPDDHHGVRMVLNVGGSLPISIDEVGADHVIDDLIEHHRSTCQLCERSATDEADPDGAAWTMKITAADDHGARVQLCCSRCSVEHAETGSLFGSVEP